ncbi:hypothetical protein [Methanococcoides burtonii]|nr:hypothetical protein [Methanococcoides burtonii]
MKIKICFLVALISLITVTGITSAKTVLNELMSMAIENIGGMLNER